MKGTRRRLLGGLAVFGVIAFALLVGLAGASTTAWSSGSVSFTDPAGDANGGVDITSVTLGASAGTLLVGVTAVGLAAVDPVRELEVDVLLDTDRDASTGSPNGNELVLYCWEDAQAKWWWDIERWTGSDWEELPRSLSAWGMCNGSDKISWQITTADVPALSAFNISVLATTWDASSKVATVGDRAPDSGVWSFEMPLAGATTQTTTTTPAPGKVRPVFGTVMLAPAVPVAGKRFGLRVAVRGDSGEPLAQGTMYCDPRVSGKLLAHTDSFSGGLAKMSLLVPKALRGKLLQVKLSVTASGGTTVKTFSFRIR